MDESTDHLHEDEDVTLFQCREPSLAEFIRTQGKAAEQSGYARTYVLRSKQGSEPRLLGYYTISMSRVLVQDLPEQFKDRVGSFPMPVALIGQLARDARAPKEARIGEALLTDALQRVMNLSSQIGCAGVVLDALNEGLVAYYARFDFVPLPRSRFPRKMFLPIQHLQQVTQAV